MQRTDFDCHALTLCFHRARVNESLRRDPRQPFRGPACLGRALRPSQPIAGLGVLFAWNSARAAPANHGLSQRHARLIRQAPKQLIPGLANVTVGLSRGPRSLGDERANLGDRQPHTFGEVLDHHPPLRDPLGKRPQHEILAHRLFFELQYRLPCVPALEPRQSPTAHLPLSQQRGLNQLTAYVSNQTWREKKQEEQSD